MGDFCSLQNFAVNAPELFRCAYISIFVILDVRTFRYAYISICVHFDVHTFASLLNFPIYAAVLLAVKQTFAQVR
jgi:hypothetical protein